MHVDPSDQEQLHAVGDELAGAANVPVSEFALPPVAGDAAMAASPPAPPPPAPPSLQEAVHLLESFLAHLSGLRIDWDTSTVLDLLACYLSSQFLLFAGPSGTGKSTAARALMSFFCAAQDQAVLEAGRQLIGPEDVAGYFSALSNSYVSVTTLPLFIGLAQSASGRPPALLVEEINLSPPEGYLSPFIHGLSGLATNQVSWPLHEAQITAVPKSLHFRPYPRLLGTINVDSTAMAPARKVTSRACVVLLEPQVAPDLSNALARLQAGTGGQSGREGLGAGMVGSPRDVLTLVGGAGLFSAEALTRPVMTLVSLVAEGTKQAEETVTASNHIRLSRRQVDQILVYVTWYALLTMAHESLGGTLVLDAAGATVDRHHLAAENALLHFVLPSLPAADLADGIRRVIGSMTPPPPDDATCGAILRPRVEQLAASGRETLGRLLDFWDRLS